MLATLAETSTRAREKVLDRLDGYYVAAPDPVVQRAHYLQVNLLVLGVRDQDVLMRQGKNGFLSIGVEPTAEQVGRVRRVITRC